MRKGFFDLFMGMTQIMSYEKPTITRYGTFRELTQATFGNFLDQQAQGQGYTKYDGDQPVLHPTAS